MTLPEDMAPLRRLDPSCLSVLRGATREFLESKIAVRWPKGYSFVVRLDGHRSGEMVGWVSTTPAVTVTLLRAGVDVRRIALLSAEQQHEELSCIDHVALGFRSRPEIGCEPVRAADEDDHLPVITKVADAEPALACEEDVLLAAGLLAALARFGDVTGMVVSTIVTPGRTVRTYVVAVPPPTAPTLPDEVRIRYESGNAHAPTGPGLICIDIHFDDSVRLLNDRHGAQRVWLAWLEPAFAEAFATATSRAGFPGRPSVRAAPPGSSSFQLSARAEDGTVVSAAGFLSPEYGVVSQLFMQLVAQMSGDAVLGFSLERGAPLVRDAVYCVIAEHDQVRGR